MKKYHYRFAAAFALFCLALCAVIQILPPSITTPVNEQTARALGLVLNSLGFPVSTAGDTVRGEGLAFRIITECTPVFSAGLFLGFVAFYPSGLREKATGLLAGMPVLYLGNLARLAATYMISLHDRRLFDVAHVYLGQVFTIFLLIMTCVAWLSRLDGKEPGQGIPMRTAGFLARFILISGCLFFVWIRIQYGYIRLLDRIMFFGFSLFDYRIDLARQTVYYYETFSIVCFASLVLSARALPPVMKVRGLAAGLGLLFFIHLFHRIDNVLIVYFNFAAIIPLDLTLLTAGQYLLPALFLIFLFHYQKNTGTSCSC